MCSSVPWRQFGKLDAGYAQFECRRKILLGAKSMMMDFGGDVAQCALGTARTSCRDVKQDGFDVRISPMPWLQERVDSVEMRTEKRKGEHNTTDHWHEGSDCSKAQETLENVDDGVARWTSSTSVECGAFAVTARAGLRVLVTKKRT